MVPCASRASVICRLQETALLTAEPVLRPLLGRMSCLHPKHELISMVVLTGCSGFYTAPLMTCRT